MTETSVQCKNKEERVKSHWSERKWLQNPGLRRAPKHI